MREKRISISGEVSIFLIKDNSWIEPRIAEYDLDNNMFLIQI